MKTEAEKRGINKEAVSVFGVSKNSMLLIVIYLVAKKVGPRWDPLLEPKLAFDQSSLAL